MNRALLVLLCLFAATTTQSIAVHRDEPKIITLASMTEAIPFQHADHLRGRDDGDQPGFPREFRVVSMEAPADVRSELQEMFPDAELSGWQVRSSKPRTIAFELENVRETRVTRHVDLDIEPDKPMRLMSCLTPIEHGNPHSLKYMLFTIRADHLLEIFEDTIDDPHEELTLKPGWSRRMTPTIESLGRRTLLSVLSWNPDESELALEDALEQGGLMMFAPDNRWFHEGVASWPRPVWIAGMRVFARSD